MTWEIALVFLIIVLIIVLFAFEVFPMDKIAFSLIGVLILTGLVTPEEGISGFSNNAVITILCLMIIAAALERNGVISWMARGLKRFKAWPVIWIIPTFMLISGSISAFISSTAVVIVFIKIITELSDKYDLSKSKLLLPISFASILGGSCTLMGTSTNLIVNSIYLRRTGERLAFFEFSLLGLIFLATAIVLVTLLSKLLPRENRKRLRDQYNLEKYILTLELDAGSELIGKRMEDTFLHDEEHITILKFTRNGVERNILEKRLILQAGDRLLVSCDMENLLRLKGEQEFIINPDEDSSGSLTQFEFKDSSKGDEEQMAYGENSVLVELMMLPGARFLGKTLRELRSSLLFTAVPIAIKKRKNLRFPKDRLYRNDGDISRLRVGDRVLVETNRSRIQEFDLYDNIAVLQQYESPDPSRSVKRTLTLLVLLGVIIVAASGLTDILTSTIVGCVALLLLNCITLESIYNNLNWQILFLLAGMIPLGLAMHNTGADDWLSAQLLGLMEGQPPFVSIGMLFLATMLMSSVVSNNATAIIMAPIAISIASGMQLAVKPFILAVMFAANFSFFTPVGYQTNALVYSMGLYGFRHFLVIGGVISLVLGILATLLLSSML